MPKVKFFAVHQNSYAPDGLDNRLLPDISGWTEITDSQLNQLRGCQDEIEKDLDMRELEKNSDGNYETKVNLIKFELVKMLLEVILSEDAEIDDKLGLKSSASSTSVPFKIAFNSLLNKKLINHY